ncbi:uncharacterized protein [Asterias amurensis]|uniref:uncharacterized protein n=1 Tax=Asterias amurensis TaxID=7602 RepID=UPI003AB4DB13
MAIKNRRKYALFVAICIYAFHATAAFIYTNFIKDQSKVNVLPFSIKDVATTRLQVELTASHKSTIRPTTVTNLWNKTDVNTAYLKKVLTLDRAPECLNRVRPHIKDSVTMVILLLSSPDKVQTRHVIRDTWANTTINTKYGFKVIFVVGLAKDKLKGPIGNESETFNDILFGNFREGTRSSTLKLLLGLKWAAQKCSGVKFVMYGSDHMFVNSETVNNYLKSLKGEELVRAWHGRRSSATIPVRDPKSVYYVSKELYPRKAFPEYCTSEAGFILTMDAVDLILEHSRHAPLVTLDDVFVSIIAEKLSFRLVNNNAFTQSDLKMGGCLPENVLTAAMRFQKADTFFEVYRNISSPESRRNCVDPRIDLVLPSNVSNHKYFEKCLKEVVSQDDVCFETGKRRDVFLILLISSLQSNFKRRQAIRETWGKQRVFFGKQTVLLFTLATETKNTAEIQKKVNEENERHGDIIQAEFRESFHNLTLKVVFGLKWVTENCPHTKYYYKGDDDMFVNMKNIIQFLEKLSKEKHKAMFIGNAMWTSIHIDDAKSRYHVSKKQYRGKFYPPYCSGGGYVISGSTIPAMYEAAQRTSIIPIDDAYHGILAKRIGVPITHNNAFKVFGSKGKNMHKCFLQESMVSHKYGTADSLRKAWTNFTDISIKCPE